MNTEKLKELLYARIIIDSHKTANIDKSYAYRDGANSIAEHVMKLVDALESISAWHLSENKIRACGGDTILTDTQIAREALNELYKDLGGLE